MSPSNSSDETDAFSDSSPLPDWVCSSLPSSHRWSLVWRWETRQTVSTTLVLPQSGHENTASIKSEPRKP